MARRNIMVIRIIIPQELKELLDDDNLSLVSINIKGGEAFILDEFHNRIDGLGHFGIHEDVEIVVEEEV